MYARMFIEEAIEFDQSAGFLFEKEVRDVWRTWCQLHGLLDEAKWSSRRLYRELENAGLRRLSYRITGNSLPFYCVRFKPGFSPKKLETELYKPSPLVQDRELVAMFIRERLELNHDVKPLRESYVFRAWQDWPRPERAKDWSRQYVYKLLEREGLMRSKKRGAGNTRPFYGAKLKERS